MATAQKWSLAAGGAVKGFTLIELLTTIAVIAVLSSFLLPALARARSRAQGIICLNNTRQLALACLMYAHDQNDRLPYNLGRPAASTNLNNWAAGILDWELTPDNTNALLLTHSALAPFLANVAATYRCPADNVLSSVQQQAGWQYRVRSYSLNASLGDAGDFSAGGYNVNNPAYVQFFKLTTIPQPAAIFAFLDEHPDSISDGYYLNKATPSAYSGYGSGSYLAGGEWLRLPASYHNGAADFSYADGHAEIHRWEYAVTKPPPMPDAAALPVAVPFGQSADFDWVVDRMSISR